MTGVAMVAEPVDDLDEADVVAGRAGYRLTADGLAALRRVVDACAEEREYEVVRTLERRALHRETGCGR